VALAFVGFVAAACGADEVAGNPVSSIVSQGDQIHQIEVTDGDSFRAVLAGIVTRARLFGINAPELDECFGPEAAARFSELAAGRSGSIVEHGRDQFDRVLVELTIDGVSVNRLLVEEGYALGDGFGSLEVAAEEGDAGMWVECRSRYPVIIESVAADPPGSDEDNLSGEVVTLRSEGSQPVDLTNWVLRDSSSRHRFTFPDWLLSPNETVAVSSGCEESETMLAWCSPGPVWNNEGDHALLIDAAGKIADHFRY
jgi:endonuclease YncB( thermonuclease family)